MSSASLLLGALGALGSSLSRLLCSTCLPWFWLGGGLRCLLRLGSLGGLDSWLFGLGSGFRLGSSGLLGRCLLGLGGSLGSRLLRSGRLLRFFCYFLRGWFLGDWFFLRFLHLPDLEAARRPGSLGLDEGAFGHQALESHLGVSFVAGLEAAVVGLDVLEDGLTAGARALLQSGDGGDDHLVVGWMRGGNLLRSLGLGYVSLGRHLDLFFLNSDLLRRESGAFLLRLTNEQTTPEARDL